MNYKNSEVFQLVSAYYQADAYSKTSIAEDFFPESNIQEELSDFLGMLKTHFPQLKIMIDDAEKNGRNGEVEKLIIKTKLTEIYKIQSWFYENLENSVNHFKRRPFSSMVEYRQIFNSASEILYSFVIATAQNFGTHISLKDGVSGIVQSILYENYWDGEELRQQINYIRNLKSSLFLSDEWIKEYAYKMIIQ